MYIGFGNRTIINDLREVMAPLVHEIDLDYESDTHLFSPLRQGCVALRHCLSVPKNNAPSFEQLNIDHTGNAPLIRMDMSILPRSHMDHLAHLMDRQFAVASSQIACVYSDTGAAYMVFRSTLELGGRPFLPLLRDALTNAPHHGIHARN